MTIYLAKEGSNYRVLGTFETRELACAIAGNCEVVSMKVESLVGKIGDSKHCVSLNVESGHTIFHLILDHPVDPPFDPYPWFRK